jgi:hypothetical protein
MQSSRKFTIYLGFTEVTLWHFPEDGIQYGRDYKSAEFQLLNSADFRVFVSGVSYLFFGDQSINTQIKRGLEAEMEWSERDRRKET